MAKAVYTLFEGNIIEARAELAKASADGRKPILMNSQTYERDKGMGKQLMTIYSIIFEQTE
jgi:hypothetical protein